MRRSRWIWRFSAAWGLVLILVLMGCDRVPENRHVGAKFCVVNSTDDDLHVYLDARYVCSVEADGQSEVERLSEGSYDALARKQSDDEIVKQQQILLEADKTFWWLID